MPSLVLEVRRILIAHLVAPVLTPCGLVSPARRLSTDFDVEWKVDVTTPLLKSVLQGKMFCRFLADERCPAEPIDRC
ncbi:hypothetical protein F2Q69_00048450 [Brassica cretica]|uniref:Uncharacterized protein n=1 Tax=Brassica cretica TaxID=69181 RepID=A0A8S9PVY4_BRACR|nr:hypothetical protein F2Q69_00048450 [Brassica cretica]